MSFYSAVKFRPFNYATAQINEEMLNAQDPLNPLRDDGKSRYLLTEKALDSLELFTQWFPERKTLGLVFRGQASSSWTLQSKLHRLYETCGLTTESRLYEPSYSEAQQIMQEEFEKCIPPTQEKPSDEQIMAIMQHYGAPTRLLDWTDSPDIALFFAFNVAPTNHSKNVVLYVADVGMFHIANFCIQKGITVQDFKPHDSLAQVFHRNIDVRDLQPGEFLRQPAFWNLRMSVQSAVFSWQDEHQSLDDYVQSDLLRTVFPTDNMHFPLLARVSIPVTERPKVMAYLSQKHITYSRLFPDLAGVCSLGESKLRDRLLKQHVSEGIQGNSGAAAAPSCLMRDVRHQENGERLKYRRCS